MSFFPLTPINLSASLIMGIRIGELIMMYSENRVNKSTEVYVHCK